MKKRLFASLLVVLLAILTACGGISDDTKNSGKFDQYRAGDFVEIMASGTYYLNFTLYMLGAKATFIMAVDGNDSSVEVDGVNLPTRMLIFNGTFYYINDEQKKILAVEGEVDEDVVDVGFFDYSDIAYSTDGNGTIADLAGIDDNAYDYEEFTAGTGENMVLVRYYFKGDNLYAMLIKTGEICQTMVIHALTNDIPDGLIEIPSGYKMVDAMGFYN